MATELAGPQAIDEPPKQASTDDGTPLKRKAPPSDEEADNHAKRQRQDANETSPTSASEGQPREGPTRPRPSSPDVSRDRRESRLQEEKKRGKRLFGGLLSTLNQTGTNSQHKRRQEIERRQQERLQKQKDEDAQKRAEKVARIRESRLVEQVRFQEQVMLHKHSKMLALAKFLKTEAEPAIYYLPWKRTANQEDTIEKQIREVRESIAQEEDGFRAFKERRASRTVSKRDSRSRRDKMAEAGDGELLASLGRPEQQHGAAEKEDDEVFKSAVQHDAHDESGDVVVEADEDLVIY